MTDLNLPDPAAIEIDDIPSAIIKISGLLASFGARLEEARHGVKPEDDILLNIDEAAQMLGVQRQWLYNRAKNLPFAKRLSRKNLRFSKIGLQAWLLKRKY